MGFPAEGAESAWRNDINEVARFFKTYHKDHFLILNLSEKTYDISKFDNHVHLHSLSHNMSKDVKIASKILKFIVTFLGSTFWMVRQLSTSPLNVN
jgi:hypothetical protein